MLLLDHYCNVKFTKTCTPEIFLELCYCVASEELIRQKTRLQAAMEISVCFCGLLLACHCLHLNLLVI